MKKFIITFFSLVLLLSSTASGKNCNYDEFKCKEESGLTPSYSRFFSQITGTNFIAERIAQSIIKKNIKKTVGGDFSVRLKSYSTKDMKAGRFKSFEIKGKHINIDSIYLSEFKMRTLCDFNYISLDKDWNMTIVYDVPLIFDITITQDDLNKTMESKEYKRLLSDINLLGAGIFTVESSSMKIKDDKIYYIMNIAIPFVRGTQEVAMCAELEAVNGDIKFVDVELLNKNFMLKSHKLSTILNYINPLDFSVKILENKDARLNINNVLIIDNKILVDGTVVLLKDIIRE